ncbi:hypothetical protein WICPIJ_007860 [Wickerhamomyces pijperi]|uniref:Deoxycytidylate deaminase n=1 Tax=Wickerhamomyces pijperi TaxID=599730 RepID=A0A9P8Q0Z0_WICPI|nr:hypothetical protein WICPIJ_007860 [Wickerhamomyces pijperi]
MLIGISGSLGSGKTELARYLTFQGFKYISFSSKSNKSNNTAANELKIDIVFESIQPLIDYVTINWRENFVLTDIDSLSDLADLEKRPFFLHISIDAPLKIRYERYKESKPTNELDFLSFIELSESQNYEKGLLEIISQAKIKILNKSNKVNDLYKQLHSLDLLDLSRLRPTWDAYFMRLADLAALRSNCMKRRVGCVIARDKRVIATGYNGTPRHLTNCNEGGCARCNSGNGSGSALSTCLCLHAEENALLESGRDRIGMNSILYCNTCPCLTCSIKIVQSGIKEVVYSQSYSMDELSFKVFHEAGVILRQYIPPMDGLVV